MRWFTSDFHFGHRNVIQYCNRPFASVEEMNEKLVQIWNAQVAPTDTVYFLGDFSLNPRYSKEFTNRLNGTKILIHGNHDATFPHKYNRKQVKMLQRYIEDGWTSIHDRLVLLLTNGRNVLLSHMPYTPAEGDKLNYDVRYLDYRPKDEGMFLLHGHLHKRYLKYGRMIDVGIDGSFKLLSEDDITALMRSKEDFIPSEITEFYKTRVDDRHNTAG